MKRKYLVIFMLLIFCLTTSCKPQNNSNIKIKDSSSNTYSNKQELNYLDFINNLNKLTMDEINIQNSKNIDGSSIACGFGGWTIFLDCKSLSGPSKLNIINNDGNYETIYETNKGISNIFIYNKNTIGLSLIEDFNYENIHEKYMKYNLITKEINEITEIGDKEYQFWWFNNRAILFNEVNGFFDIYYLENNANKKLIDKNIKYYSINNDKLFYYIKDSSDLYFYDFDKNKKTYVTTIKELESFKIYNNKLIFETLGSLNIYNLDNKEIFTIQGSNDMYIYNVHQMAFDNNYMYTLFSEGLYKISYDGKEKTCLAKDKTVRCITLLDDWIYFISENYSNDGLSLIFNTYRIKYDGTNLQNINY